MSSPGGTLQSTKTKPDKDAVAAASERGDGHVTEAAGARTPSGAGLQGSEEVLVLDFGGQYSQLIARRIRECGVFSELLPHDSPIEELRRRRPRGLVLSGGPASVYSDDAPPLRPELLELGIPVLGICYGMQAMALALGGQVEGAEVAEFGRTELQVRDSGRLLAGLPREQTCWMSHRDTVFAPPPGFAALASSPASPVAAFESVERGLYGIQFHPEVVHTPHGTAVLRTFLRDVCGCEQEWTPASIVEEQVELIRAQVGDGRAICGLSGGVDSSVAALIVHRALGDRLVCVLVDHGLLRKDEAAQVVRTFGEHFDVPLVPEDYIHRVGRTGRAEATGEAFTFVAPDEEGSLRDIERAIGRRLPLLSRLAISGLANRLTELEELVAEQTGRKPEGAEIRRLERRRGPDSAGG